jgi:heme oxygenase (biliverdin-IX-beta and delta-forming)
MSENISIGERLKAETMDQHMLAERHPFHRVLFGAEGPARARLAYTWNLGQHVLIQRTFEGLLRQGAAAGGVLGAMVKPHHLYGNAAEADLTYLEADAGVQRELGPTRACREYFEGIGATPALVGAWYVLEGSTNGGTIIAKRVREVLGLPDERGTTYINPHGVLVRPRWMEWKQGLEANLAAAAHEEVIEAARRTFAHIAGVMTGVMEAIGGAQIGVVAGQAGNVAGGRA